MTHTFTERIAEAYGLIEQVQYFQLDGAEKLAENPAQREALQEASRLLLRLRSALNRASHSIPPAQFPCPVSRRELAAHQAAGWALAAHHLGHRVQSIQIDNHGRGKTRRWWRWWRWEDQLTTRMAGAIAEARVTGADLSAVLAMTGPVPKWDLYHASYSEHARDLLDEHAEAYTALVASLLEHDRLPGRWVHRILGDVAAVTP